MSLDNIEEGLVMSLRENAAILEDLEDDMADIEKKILEVEEEMYKTIKHEKMKMEDYYY